MMVEHEYKGISIHAPRVGSDIGSRNSTTTFYHFNPRSPCGERLTGRIDGLVDEIFQSTLPVWGATLPILCFIGKGMISIHAPRVGSDLLG